LVRRLRLVIVPSWVSRELGWIPAADFLSRVVGRRQQAEWSIPRDVFEDTVRAFRVEPQLDLFASAGNRRRPRYCSRYPERASEGDALSRPWPRGDVYGFPPFALLGRALQHWRHTSPQSRFLLVAPAAHPELERARLRGEVVQERRLVSPLEDIRGVLAPRPLDRPMVWALLVLPRIRAAPAGH
jgi:hypothetical protein